MDLFFFFQAKADPAFLASTLEKVSFFPNSTCVGSDDIFDTS